MNEPCKYVLNKHVGFSVFYIITVYLLMLILVNQIQSLAKAKKYVSFMVKNKSSG